jgi:hypothetical protein
MQIWFNIIISKIANDQLAQGHKGHNLRGVTRVLYRDQAGSELCPVRLFLVIQQAAFVEDLIILCSVIIRH